jgi:RimJ/RimL family protein N-acetyltransferase
VTSEGPAPSGWTTDRAASYGTELLTGELVRLRATTEADLPLLDQWWHDPAVAALQQATVRPGPPGTATERFRGWSANDTDGAAGFSVEETGTGDLAGHVTLWGATARTRSSTLALMLGPAARGRGLGTATVALTLRYAFAEMGLHRVGLSAWAFNERALRAYRACGFVEEGRRREVVLHGGRWHDEVLMSVLDREWWARPGNATL